MNTSRRTAIKAAAWTALSYSRVAGANDRIHLGVIGTGVRGTSVMTSFQRNAEVQVDAVCDIYATRADEAASKAPGAKTYSDHRRVLEIKELNAVLIGTPDHWHAGTAIDALNAGKDVYVEKPLMRLREEGPAIVRAARVNNRICQVGMQQRSGTIYLEAKQRFVDTGMLGRITHIRCVWNSGPPGGPSRRQTFTEKPANLDWARFLGPVRWREWNPYQYQNFRAFLDFGGGKMTDFGAHWIDVAHMFTGKDGPLSVSTAGGVYYEYADKRDAPDNITAIYEYPGGLTVTFESLTVANGSEYGVEFLGDKGRLFINRNRYEFLKAEKGAQPVSQRIPGDITSEHVRNFLDCCKSRKLPNGDVYHGHRSAQACLLAVESYVERRRIRFDPAREIVLPA
ncbi:MAG: Gfo/Idh/MocA family oxidoreductase [Bryobacterales bacterium]|nr:Gfo/Idh/MocA family oxidoreductase [Bryobacterales bacterium]